MSKKRLNPIPLKTGSIGSFGSRIADQSISLPVLTPTPHTLSKKSGVKTGSRTAPDTLELDIETEIATETPETPDF